MTPSAPALASAAPLRELKPPALADVLDAATLAALTGTWWPLSRLGEGLAELARRGGLLASGQEVTLPAAPAPDDTAGRPEVAAWVGWAASRLGLEAEPVDAAHPELDALLRHAGPALLPCARPAAADSRDGHDDGDGEPPVLPGFVLLLGWKRGAPVLLGPDLQPRRVPAEGLRRWLAWPLEAPRLAEIDHLLASAGVAPRRQPAVRAAMLRERLSTARCGSGWLLRLPATAGFWSQLVHAGLPRRIGAMLGLFVLLYALELLGWKLIGSALLDGRLDFGWLAAWLLLGLSLVPLRWLGGWLDAGFALDAGRILKARLLAGALRLPADAVRTQGVGHLLGRVIESQALESLAVGGALSLAVAVLELVFAGWILSVGAGGGLHVALLVGWLALTLAGCWRWLRRLRAWTAQRLDLTHALIERMVGHRTRLAQEQPARRDAQDDQALQAYAQASQAMDRASAPVLAGVPAGWLPLGLAGLVPALAFGVATPGLAGGGTSAALVAVAIGGLLMAQRALAGIVGSIGGLGRAALAWQQVRELFQAGHQDLAAQPYLPQLTAGAGQTAPGQAQPATLVDAQGLGFGYRTGEPVLHGAQLTIRHGERILLEGASGGGKSTLASLLTGLRQPTSGLLLLAGLDHHTLGAHWQRLATSAPQFHDNHVLSGTLAFNLLMGREWPASPADLAEATELCEALGLGPLIRRMPGGLMQRVGETGWQLSHGERSRVFLARALLQKAPLTVLDESFGALDPATLALCLRCAIERTQTLVVIAHP